MYYKKYLPIGTVVMLKNGKKRIMITGFCSFLNEDKSKMFDYSGCLYPEGFISHEKTLLFDHSQIEKVYSVGYSDDEDVEFKKRLGQVLTLDSEQKGLVKTLEEIYFTVSHDKIFKD